MTRASRAERERRAAVRGFFSACAMGGTPTADDLAQLGFPTSTHPTILASAEQVRVRRAAGDHQAARRLAAESADALLADLGDSWTPPSAEPDLDGLSPTELAAFITSGVLPARTDPDDPVAAVRHVPR